MNRVLLSLVLFISLAVAASTALAQDQHDIAGFQAFWDRFRGAVAAHDSAAIANMTFFPFSFKVDDGAVSCLTREKFLPYANRVFDQRSYDSEASGGTYRDLVAAHARVLTNDFLSAPDRVRIGNLKFKRVKGIWYFYLAYRS